MLGSDRDVPRSIIGFNPVACSWTCLVEIRVRGGLDVVSNKAVFGIYVSRAAMRDGLERLQRLGDLVNLCSTVMYFFS